MTIQTPVAAMPMSSPADHYDKSRVRPEVAAAMAKINELGPVFAARAEAVDDEASFPTASYRDLADAGFLGLLIPVEFGGWGFSIGVAQGACDFTVAYLKAQVPGQPSIDRRMHATKRVAVSKMYARLAHMRAVVAGQGEGEAVEGRGDADVCRAIQRDGGHAGNHGAGDPHLRRAVHAALAAAGTDASRQPLRGANAALYLGNHGGLHRVLALYEMDELDTAPGYEGGARNSLWRGDAGSLKGLR